MWVFRYDHGLGRMAHDLIRESGKGNQEKLVILPFNEIKGPAGPFGYFLSESLLTRLRSSPRFTLLERGQLNKVMGELRLDLSGAVEPSTAKKIGQLLGADWVCLGTYAVMADEVDVNSRLVTVDTGELRATSSARIRRDKNVSSLLTGQEPVVSVTAVRSAAWAEERARGVTPFVPPAMMSAPSREKWAKESTPATTPADKVIAEAESTQKQIAKLELFLKENPGVFNWAAHNELRHLYSFVSQRKSLEQSDIILKNSLMDNYILSVLSGWQIGKDTASAIANLLANTRAYPDLRFASAASFIKIGDLYMTEDNLEGAKIFYSKVSENQSSDLAQYRDMARDRIQTLTAKTSKQST